MFLFVDAVEKETEAAWLVIEGEVSQLTIFLSTQALQYSAPLKIGFV
jgi:hypothetical protein